MPTEQKNQHVPSRRRIQGKFAYTDVSDPLKGYHGKGSMENVFGHIEVESKRLYETFLEHPIFPLIEIIPKRVH